MKFISVIILLFALAHGGMAQSLFGYRVETIEEAEKKMNALRNLSYEYLVKNQQSNLDKVLEGYVILDMPGIFVDTLRAFYKEEIVMFRFLQKKFKLLSVISVDESKPASAILDTKQQQQALVPLPDDLLESLLKRAFNEKQSIVMAMKKSSLPPYQKDFLGIYLEYMLIQSQVDSFNKEALVSMAREYMVKYPHNPYTSFVEENINLSYKTSDFGIGSGLFAGANFITQPMGDKFSGGMPVGGLFDLAYKRLFLYLHFNGSFGSKIKQDFTFNEDLWQKNTRTTLASGGAALGFSIISNERYSVTPFAGISSLNISSFVRSEDEGEITLKMDDFPFLNAGVNFDLRIKHKAAITNYHERFIADHDKTYWNIRFRAGFMNTQFEKQYPDMKGSMFYVGVGIGIFTFPAVRVND